MNLRTIGYLALAWCIGAALGLAFALAMALFIRV